MYLDKCTDPNGNLVPASRKYALTLKFKKINC